MRKIFVCIVSVVMVAFFVNCASKNVESAAPEKTKAETTVKETKADATKETEVKTATSKAVSSAEAPTTVSAINVEDAVIATNVDNLTPSGAGTEFTKDTPKIFCYSKITGAETETAVKHKWYHNNELTTEIELPVKANSWRTYSYKTMVPELAGSWKVDITDRDGKILKSLNFEIK